MKKLSLLLLCSVLALFVLLFSSCQFIPSVGGTESESESQTESETEAETLPALTDKNTVFVLYERDGERANVTVSITGEVCLAGMEGSLRLPAGASVQSLKAEGGVVIVQEEGEIAWTFLSQTGENVTAETVLFTFATEWTETSPAVTVKDAFDSEMQDVEFCVEFYAFGK